jgi:hypothetical protein
MQDAIKNVAKNERSMYHFFILRTFGVEIFTLLVSHLVFLHMLKSSQHF